MSSSTLFLDPDLRMRREDHSDGLLCRIFGALIRMLRRHASTPAR